MDIPTNNLKQILNVAEDKIDVIEVTHLTPKVCLDHDSLTQTTSAIGEGLSDDNYEVVIYSPQKSSESFCTSKSLTKNIEINKVNLKCETVSQETSNNSEDNNQCNQIESCINGNCPSFEKNYSENNDELNKIHKKPVNFKVSNNMEHLEIESSNPSFIDEVQTELQFSSTSNIVNNSDPDLKDFCKKYYKSVSKISNLNTAPRSINCLEYERSDEKKRESPEKLDSSIGNSSLKHTDINISCDTTIASRNGDDLNKKEPFEKYIKLPSQNPDLRDNGISPVLNSEHTICQERNKVVNASNVKKDIADSSSGILTDSKETYLINEKSSVNEFDSEIDLHEDEISLLNNGKKEVFKFSDDFIETESKNDKTLMLENNIAGESFIKTDCDKVAKISHDTYSFSNFNVSSSSSSSSNKLRNILVEPDLHIENDTDLPVNNVENSYSHDSALRPNIDNSQVSLLCTIDNLQVPLPCTTQENQVDCTLVAKELGIEDGALVSTNKNIVRNSSVSQSSSLDNSILLKNEQSFQKCEILSGDYTSCQQTLGLLSPKTVIEDTGNCSFELNSAVNVEGNNLKELKVPCSYSEKKVSNYDIESSKKFERESNCIPETECIVNTENAYTSRIENSKAITLEHGDKCNSKTTTLENGDKCNSAYENIGTCIQDECSCIFNGVKRKESYLVNKTRTEKHFDPKITEPIKFDTLSKNLCTIETEGRVEKEANSIIEPKSIGDKQNVSETKEILSGESNHVEPGSFCATQNFIQMKKESNFSEIKENLTEVSNCMKLESCDEKQKSIELKDNTIERCHPVESEKFGDSQNFLHRKANLTKESNVKPKPFCNAENNQLEENIMEKSIHVKHKLTNLNHTNDNIMEESNQGKRETVSNLQNLTQSKDNLKERPIFIVPESVDDKQNFSHMKEDTIEESNHVEPEPCGNAQNLNQRNENKTEESNYMKTESLGDEQNFSEMDNFTKETNQRERDSFDNPQHNSQTKENIPEDSDLQKLESLTDSKNFKYMKVSLIGESDQDQPKLHGNTQNFRSVEGDLTEEFKSFSAVKNIIETKVNLIEESNDAHVELKEESNHVQPKLFVDTKNLNQSKENLITDSNVQFYDENNSSKIKENLIEESNQKEHEDESLDDTQNFNGKDNLTEEHDYMFISDQNNERNEQLLIQNEDKNNPEASPVAFLEGSHIFENDLSDNSKLKKSYPFVDIHDSPRKKKIRCEDIFTTDVPLSDAEINFEGFIPGDHPKYDEFHVYQLKYNLKECEVNLKESKIDESIILKNSKELMLDKPNFRQVKRKLEDMLYDARVEEENVINKIEKMRQEKKCLLKNILFHMKKFKKKHGFT